MSRIRPWARGPLDLVAHAERHLRSAGDFDRRIALIGFDNAIEVTITCYLTLNPVQRGGRKYERFDVERWMVNYHAKLDFLFEEAQGRGISLECEKEEIVWYHNVRNGQYHGGSGTVPEMADLLGVRKAALSAFGFLFEVENVEGLLDARIKEEDNRDIPQRNDKYDALIDGTYGTVEIGGQVYSTSEALYSIDAVAYSEVGRDLEQISQEIEAKPQDETCQQLSPSVNQ